MGLGQALGLLLLLGALGWVACELHSLCYFHTAVSEPSPGVPQFVSLGYVDGNLISRYDSEKGRTVPRADWMAANLDQQHWDQQTQIEQTNQEIYTVNLDTLQSRYNQSGGAHTFQSIVSCDLLEDNSTRGYWQIAYDGRDFIAFDMDTMTFTAADAAAQITKRNWEADRTVTEHMKHYLENTCPEWLRKYVSYGQAVLERKEPPTVRVLKKETQGILTLHCHAYGFYPRPISIIWLKDGEVRDQETERGSIVPNSDGTYYTWVSIEAHPGEQDKYRCRVEHNSLAEPGVFAWEPVSNQSAIVPWVVVPLAILAIIFGIIVFLIWKYRPGLKGYGKALSQYRGQPNCSRKDLILNSAISWSLQPIMPSSNLHILNHEAALVLVLLKSIKLKFADQPKDSSKARFDNKCPWGELNI
ncbi:class I histocompatibility antigen, F10 alpha chain-like [Porphyrio hochstetteri]